MILLRGKVGHRRLHGPYQSQLVGPSLFLGLYFAVGVSLLGWSCLDLVACTFAAAAWFICDLLTHSHEICRIYCLPLCTGCDPMRVVLEYVGFGLNEGGLELLFVGFKS